MFRPCSPRLSETAGSPALQRRAAEREGETCDAETDGSWQAVLPAGADRHQPRACWNVSRQPAMPLGSLCATGALASSLGMKTMVVKRWFGPKTALFRILAQPVSGGLQLALSPLGHAARVGTCGVLQRTSRGSRERTGPVCVRSFGACPRLYRAGRYPRHHH